MCYNHFTSSDNNDLLILMSCSDTIISSICWISFGRGFYTGHTYLISDGRDLSLSDILEGADKEISDLVDQYKQGIVDYYDAERIMASPFVLTDGGLCFMCNVGDAVPRAEIMIPYTDPGSYVISVDRKSGGNSTGNSDSFEGNSQSQKTDDINESSLVMDQVTYSNMEREDDIPSDSKSNGIWIWSPGGIIACGIILIVILKKKSRK